MRFFGDKRKLKKIIALTIAGALTLGVSETHAAGINVHDLHGANTQKNVENINRNVAASRAVVAKKLKTLGDIGKIGAGNYICNNSTIILNGIVMEDPNNPLRSRQINPTSELNGPIVVTEMPDGTIFVPNNGNGIFCNPIKQYNQVQNHTNPAEKPEQNRRQAELYESIEQNNPNNIVSIGQQNYDNNKGSNVQGHKTHKPIKGKTSQKADEEKVEDKKAEETVKHYGLEGLFPELIKGTKAPERKAVDEKVKSGVKKREQEKKNQGEYPQLENLL